MEEKKNQISANDEKIIEQLKQNNIQLNDSWVRKRQQTCTFKDAKKDELPSYAKNFQPARRITLQQMLSINKEDESLQKYKQSLVGKVNKDEINQQEVSEVQILKIEIISQERPEGSIILDFSKDEKKVFTIKEGSVYFMRIYFMVKYDCVYGLKFVNNVWRQFIKVDKYEETMGSFSPKEEIQTYDLHPEEAPSGILQRGSYKGKIMILDNDGIIHMQFEYECKISKKWID